MLLALVCSSFSSWWRDRSRVSSFSTAFPTANWTIPNGPWFGSGPVKTLCQGVIVFPRSPMSLTSSAHPWKWFPCSQHKFVDICSMHQMPDVFWGTTCASQQKSVTWNLSAESPSLLLVHPVEPWFPDGTPQLRAMWVWSEPICKSRPVWHPYCLPRGTHPAEHSPRHRRFLEGKSLCAGGHGTVPVCCPVCRVGRWGTSGGGNTTAQAFRGCSEGGADALCKGWPTGSQPAEQVRARASWLHVAEVHISG